MLLPVCREKIEICPPLCGHVLRVCREEGLLRWVSCQRENEIRQCNKNMI